MSKQLEINYGVLGGTLKEQLDNQGFKMAEKRIAHYDKLRDSANRLHLSDMMTDSEFERVLGRLHKRITKDLNNG